MFAFFSFVSVCFVSASLCLLSFCSVPRLLQPERLVSFSFNCFLAGFKDHLNIKGVQPEVAQPVHGEMMPADTLIER